MGGMSRAKGQRGEREAAAVLSELTGREVRRRVRQHLHDADLEGLEGWGAGWAVEVKRVASCPPAMLAQYWAQAVTQAERAGLVPLLMVRVNRAADWTCYWPAALHHDCDVSRYSRNPADTLSADPMTWFRVVRPPRFGSFPASAGAGSSNPAPCFHSTPGPY